MYWRVCFPASSLVISGPRLFCLSFFHSFLCINISAPQMCFHSPFFCFFVFWLLWKSLHLPLFISSIRFPLALLLKWRRNTFYTTFFFFYFILFPTTRTVNLMYIFICLQYTESHCVCKCNSVPGACSPPCLPACLPARPSSPRSRWDSWSYVPDQGQRSTLGFHFPPTLPVSPWLFVFSLSWKS